MSCNTSPAGAFLLSLQLATQKHSGQDVELLVPEEASECSTELTTKCLCLQTAQQGHSYGVPCDSGAYPHCLSPGRSDWFCLQATREGSDDEIDESPVTEEDFETEPRRSLRPWESKPTPPAADDVEDMQHDLKADMAFSICFYELKLRHQPSPADVQEFGRVSSPLVALLLLLLALTSLAEAVIHPSICLESWPDCFRPLFLSPA